MTPAVGSIPPGRDDLLATVQSRRVAERRVKVTARRIGLAIAVAIIVAGAIALSFATAGRFGNQASSASFRALASIGLVVVAVICRAVALAVAAPSIHSARQATARAESQLYAFDAAQQYRPPSTP